MARKVLLLALLALSCALSFAIEGDDGPNSLVGTEDDDYIYAYGGPDEVEGNGGDDLIEGGSDTDVLYGDGGNDEIDGDEGDDYIYGGDGVDTLAGGEGADEIEGGDGDDVIFGGDATGAMGTDGGDILAGDAGDDDISGGGGQDELIGGPGVDTLRGGDGDDYLDATDFASIDALADGGAGTDTLVFCEGRRPVDVQGIEIYIETSDAAVCGDPHFMGFDGESFDYSGEAGRFFNVLTTKHAMVNALLSWDTVHGLTYMTSIGVSMHHQRVQITSPAEAGGSMMVSVNDIPVTVGTEPMDVGNGVVIKRTTEKEIQILSDALAVGVSLHKDIFLDLTKVVLPKTLVEVHGVLGQTARPDHEGYHGYLGEEADYFTSSLWVDDFLYGAMYKDGAKVVNRKMGEWLSHSVVGDLLELGPDVVAQVTTF